jgi:LPS export ABC transporter permease LptG/LPS export ABC transporter permease LptF
VKTLDRYLIRETIPPFMLALAVFTFVMAVKPILENAEILLVKGLPVPTVGFLLLTLLPQALGVTIPAALLTGLLMALGRLSADSEGVALLACGVSPMRILRPVMGLAVVVGGLHLYVMLSAIPDANLTFLEVTTRHLAKLGESDIKPRVFYEGFPGKVILLQDRAPDGTWAGVLLADTSKPGQPTLTLADSGRLQLDEERHEVNLFLTNARRYRPETADGESYERSVVALLRIEIPASSVFGGGNLSVSRGLAEKTIADLEADIATKRAAGLSPHNEIMYLHQKFSFPIACLIFAPIALVLGLHTRREGKLAGLVLGLGVVFVYYGLMAQAEAWTKGQYFPAGWARWVPNIALGVVGLVGLVWKMRSSNRQVQVSAPLAFVQRLRRGRPTGLPRAGSGVSAPALVIRIPELRLPRPRLLDIYVSNRYLRISALTFAALLGLSYLGAFLDRSEKLFKGQADFSMLAQFLWFYTPQLVNYIIPIATLVAVLGTIGGLTRTGELTVMRACGVSLYRAAAPLILMAVVLSGVLFLLEERVLARANQRAEAIDDVIRGNAAHTVDVVANRHWFAEPDGRIYYYLVYDQRQRLLIGLSVFSTATAPYRLDQHTYARLAAFDPASDAWNAQDGWAQHFPAAGESRYERFAARPLVLATPSDFAGAQVDAEMMNYSQLRTYLARLEGSGFNLADQRMALQRKLAFPAVTLVMTLIALPFGVTTGRRGALYGIGLAIVLAFSYFLMTAFFAAAGRAGVLPPVVAAWAANVFFLIAAIYLILTAKT